MVQPWRKLSPPEDIDVIAPDGAIRCRVVGYYSGNDFFIDDMKADVRPGDEIRRTLPNGREEAFTVQDPKYHAGGHFGAHYHVKIGRGNVFPKQTGGNYNINVSGSNPRVNIHSSDQSINTAIDNSVFSQIRKALDDGIQHQGDREQLKKLLGEIEAAQDKKGFTTGYQKLIASAASHMAVIAPFLPALTDLLNRFAQ